MGSNLVREYILTDKFETVDQTDTSGVPNYLLNLVDSAKVRHRIKTA